MIDNNTSAAATDFLKDRSFAQLDAFLSFVLPSLVAYISTRLGIKTVLIRKSLRVRLLIISAVLLIAALIALHFDIHPGAVVAGAIVGQIVVTFYALKSLADVGLLNAFETTKKGVSAGTSLKMTNKSVSFLGIGAKKLIDDENFDAAMKRCKASGGSIKLLLSSPDNPALEDIARQNGRYDASYKSRVRESISEINNRTRLIGVTCEIRLYSLGSRIALPHFRLMFIDDEICVFSQLVWNDSEGLDNPQLIVKRKPSSQASSLYIGYKSYFDDLWEASAGGIVDDALVASWR